LQSALLGAVFGYVILWGVNYLFRKVRGIDGMGCGDFKLLSAIGAWAGWQMLPLVIFLSSVAGIFVALLIIKVTGRDIKAQTPFGPTLAAAGLVAILYGNDIIRWYAAFLV
jgi:leader peptidase (prepilin peptidase) / N-methyltransferase